MLDGAYAFVQTTTLAAVTIPSGVRICQCLPNGSTAIAGE
jgi:hypothetical protein